MWKTSIKESLKRKLRSVVARKDYNTAHACAHISFTFIDSLTLTGWNPIQSDSKWYELFLRCKYPCIWIWIQKCLREIIPIHSYNILYGVYNVYCTSSTARGGGGSFKIRKRIGEIGCCESRMTKQKHWWIELSNCVTDYLPNCLTD